MRKKIYLHVLYNTERRLIMDRISQVSFNGLWAPVKVLEKESGVFYRNKVYYKLCEKVYLPWKDETPEQIAKAVDKHFVGRGFSVMDVSIGDSQHKYDAYHMNYIKIGNPIERSDAQKFIEQGYSEDFVGGILSKNDFYDAYSNASYSPFDIHEMDKEAVIDFAKRHFDINV